jgi:asparagine synthetase B (glutamine-hydrolysing)
MVAWFQDEWLDHFSSEPHSESKPSKRDRLTRRLYLDTMGGELQELLRYGDRNSMAWSRELRQPFLDHRLAEFLFALPPQYKLSNGETKVVFRTAMQHLVPRSILVRQDKLGYQAPLATWLKGALADWVHGSLGEASSELSGRVVKDPVARFRGMQKIDDEYAWRALFSLLTLGETKRQLQQVRCLPAVR